MPYIAFDLDALNVVPHVAKATSLEPERVTHGLVGLWAYCFREATDRVTRIHLLGFFGAEMADALSAFGFLEPMEDGTFRVRGAERYLRIRASRVEGGKKAAGNLKRGKVRAGGEPETLPGCVPAGAGEEPEVEPERAPGSGPALTPNTEHRTPNLKTLPLRRAHEPSGPGLGEALQDVFRQEKNGAAYSPDHGDEQALRPLLAMANGDEAEIIRRWRIGLKRQRYPTISTWRELAQSKCWNACAAEEAQGPPRGKPDIRKSPIRAEDVPREAFKVAGVANDF
jgi:hypothetical protein